MGKNVPSDSSNREVKLREHLLAPLYRLEAPSRRSLIRCSACQKEGKTLYRCRDCFGGRMRCRRCIVSRHVEIPFHQVEKWTGVYFKRTSLGELGLRLYCGHHGAPCPSGSHESMAVLTIVDSGGIHRLPVYACRCPNSKGVGRSFAVQLLLMRLFPATDGSPETAATFHALEDFDVHNLCGKESMWDYSEALQRKSNSAQPHLVPVSAFKLLLLAEGYVDLACSKNFYNPFRHMSRQFRTLIAIKRTGNYRVEDLRPGDLVVQCPSCPRPGVNMPAGWKEDKLRYEPNSSGSPTGASNIECIPVA